jgi:predicted MFS family arabinose efflux permease
VSYRALSRSAPLTFFPLGFFARLSYAITSLGSLLLIQHATGSHAFAGLAAGAQNLAIAVAGFAAGGLAARFGARRLGMTLTVLNVLAAVTLVAASTFGSRPAMVGAAVLVGLTQPHVGLFVRVHWSHTLGRGTPALRTAFAYESAVDELSFVIGPAVVGLFALVRPGDGPVLGMVLLLVATSLPFAAMYTRAAAPRQASGRLPWRRMALLVGGMAAVGAIFGSIQTATAAHAVGDAGFLYACLGMGSVVSGIAYGWLPRSFGVNTRYVVFSATLVLGMVFLALSPWLPLGILAAGFSIAPYMITLYTLTDTLAPPARLPVAMAALGAGGPVGTAVGQAVTGALVDGPGLGVAWFVPAGCASVGLLVALAWLRAARPRPRQVCPTGREASRERPTPPVPSP